MGKLPKDAKVGTVATITTERKTKKGILKRDVTFEKMKEKGFGSWKVLSNKPHKE